MSKPRWWIEHASDLGIDGFGELWVMRVEWHHDGRLQAASQPIDAEIAEDTACHPRLAASIAARFSA